MTRFTFEDAELASRRTFFELTDDDLARLASLRPFAERHTHAIVEQFYEHLLRHPETRRFFPDEAAVQRVKRTQREYFLGLFAGRCDLAYVQDRLRVGAAHERIGLSSKWYLGAYRLYMRLIHERLTEDFADPAQAHEFLLSIQKIVSFDMALAIDAYLAARTETVRRHQEAIRELSTPVIAIHEGILLLPLVGAVDSARAQQVMDSVLARVVEARAKCILLDVSGVPVVDSQVADALVQTTAALRLLGAEAILTGVSAQVARTMVHLGIDLSTMHTVTRLGAGIELALSMLGKRVAPHED